MECPACKETSFRFTKVLNDMDEYVCDNCGHFGYFGHIERENEFSYWWDQANQDQQYIEEQESGRE